VALREIDVAVDVALGIEHDRLAGALAADEVGALGEVLVVDESPEHGWFSVGAPPSGTGPPLEGEDTGRLRDGR
jgi:hypothetical protein